MTRRRRSPSRGRRFARKARRAVVDRLPVDNRHAGAVVLLAGVLALDHADRATIGAVAPALKTAFHLHNTQIGILAGAFSIVTAIATLPVGVLTDRTRRMTLLGASIGVWSGAMVLAGASPTFLALFGAHMILGIATATGGPTIASITGDLFPADRRGRILGVIESGELVGTGLGFVVAGALAASLSWRFSFWILAVPGIAIAVLTTRTREPRRTGGEHERVVARRAAEGDDREETSADEILKQEARRDPDIRPDKRNVLRGDQSRMRLWPAVHYTVRVPTNVILIVSGAFGNFFFAIVRTFAVVFFIHQYGLSLRVATLLVPLAAFGALIGIVAGGRIGDELIRRGVLAGRIHVGIWSFITAGILFIPAVLIRNIWAAAPLYVLGAAALSAPNPAIDAARLDVIHPQLWGRAEGVRTIARSAAEAIAPVLFGVLSDHLGGGGTRGTQLAMLVVLPVLVANGLVLLFALRTYAPDVAAVVASSSARSRASEGRKSA